MKIIIFAGGVGTRLWPVSRKNTPKQFEKIYGDYSTLQLAAKRLQPDFSWDDLYVSTGKAYVDIVAKQLPKMPKDHIIGEPEMRDVGPAVGLIAGILMKESPDEPMAILWSDHLVAEEEHFRKILLTAGEVVTDDPGKIIFVGQKPRFASVNLGWIDYGGEVFSRNDLSFRAFLGFKYKPETETAEQYIKSGHHAWNLGYFVTTPRFLWSRYKTSAPEIFNGLQKITENWKTGNFSTVLEEVYPTLEKIHFDNAILEKLDPSSALVISENIGWSDIGAWEALKEALTNSEEENLVKGNVMLEDSRDSLAFNYTNQLCVGIDLDKLLVITTPDVILVCPKTSVPKIKKFVEKLAGTPHEHLT